MRPGDAWRGYVPCGWRDHGVDTELWHLTYRGDHHAAFEVDDDTGEIVGVIERHDPRYPS